MQCLPARVYQSYLSNLLLSVIRYFKKYMYPFLGPPKTNVLEVFNDKNERCNQARHHMKPLNLQLGIVGLRTFARNVLYSNDFTTEDCVGGGLVGGRPWTTA